MKQLVVLAAIVCLGAASPVGLLGDPGAIYGRLQRNSYVPYAKPDYTRLYMALKNARLQDAAAAAAAAAVAAEPDYEYEPSSRPIGAIFEAPDDVAQYDDGRHDLAAQQQWLDIGTLYDAPIDEEGLEQQNDMVRQIMSNYVEKKSELKKATALNKSPAAMARNVAGSTEAPVKASTATTTTSTTVRPGQQQKVKEHKEDKVPKASKLHGQKEYAMLRPAGAAEARRPLPEVWPEDVEVQQLKRAARRLFRKPVVLPPTQQVDELTSELDSLPAKKH